MLRAAPCDGVHALIEWDRGFRTAYVAGSLPEILPVASRCERLVGAGRVAPAFTVHSLRWSTRRTAAAPRPSTLCSFTGGVRPIQYLEARASECARKQPVWGSSCRAPRLRARPCSRGPKG